MASYSAPKKALCQRRQQRNILYIAGNDELYGELLQGGLEAWTVERGMCNDGFTFDFGASLDHSNFLEDNNVVCWTRRRTSPMNNDAAVSPHHAVIKQSTQNKNAPGVPLGAGAPSSSTPRVSLGLTQTSVSCEPVHVSRRQQSTRPLCERYVSLCFSLVFHPAALTPSLQHHLPAVTTFILLKTIWSIE